MAPFAGWESSFYTILAVFARVSSFWVVLPVLRRGVPVLAKVGFAALLSGLLMPVLSEVVPPSTLSELAVGIASESLVGLLIGFMVSFILSSLYLAGQLIDVQMGFGAVSLFDPQTGDHVPMIAQFQNAVALLLFFLMDGHHGLLYALASSFEIVPIGSAGFGALSLSYLINLFAQLFILALRIALPVMAAVFLTDLALGIVTRAVPQMNVFVVGFPVKIGVGLFIYLLAFPVVVGILAGLVGPQGDIVRGIYGLLPLLGGAG